VNYKLAKPKGFGTEQDNPVLPITWVQKS